jgi:putative oxidoreductase
MIRRLLLPGSHASPKPGNVGDEKLMQRLFSTFPNGWPGCGLLLLRVTCSAPLLVIGSAKLWGAQVDASFWIELFSSLTAMLILAGLWTPLAASSQAVLQGVLAFASGTFEWAPLVLAITNTSLVMLGPGSLSIDARLYGRKRIDLGRSHRAP